MELLAIPEVVEKLGLSYSTSKELNTIIDSVLPSPPPFQCMNLSVGGEELEFHYHEIIPNPEFAWNLIYAPEWHYTNAEQTCCVYNEMHTSDWWWFIQMSLEACNPGATVTPIIISTDKTQLTLFQNKSAYPVYLGIGNILKDIRRKPSRAAQMLVGYIPTTKLGTMTNKAAHCRALANLCHSCMGKLLDPIQYCGETGLPMLSGDGTWHRCHPIFATFVGDYLEQTLVTCTLNGHCPKCVVSEGQLGDHKCFPAWNYADTLNTYDLANEDTHQFHSACRTKGLKPIFRPFWYSLPLVDMFLSITPDVLHQILQGVVKHITAWISDPALFGNDQINIRCHAIPPNHHTTLFPKGITMLSCVSGKEHKAMCQFLLGLIVDLPLPGGQAASRVLRAVHALLDFVHLAQYPSHTTRTLDHLEECLRCFHKNKAVFVDLSVCTHLNIPKFHSLLHYHQSITLFSSTDNYNTEQSEHLHIDLTKNAFCATNKKDEYPQMTVWVEQREKIHRHSAFIKWRQQDHPTDPSTSIPIEPLQIHPRYLKMAKNPTMKATFGELATKYSVIDFQDALADFIASMNYPGASGAALRNRTANTLIPFQLVPIFHRFKYTSSSNLEDLDIIDWMHVPSQFDTMLVHGKDQDTRHGTNGNQIAQIRAVFQIPSQVVHNVFLNNTTLSYLTYAEWFSPLPQTPDVNHLMMYKVSRSTHDGRQRASIIPVNSIIGSVHLIPRFGPVVPKEWRSFSVLELCNTFYVNPFSYSKILVLSQ
ncbi:hypothetical protein EI94DRAFT_1780739 [Lactarius quietus]|nr:hypothetical protein EI94DRAFT_1780739 [Lactarius quietus]